MKSFFLGVEIGGTKLQIGLGDENGNIISTKKGKVSVEKGPEGILQWFEKNLQKLLEISLPSNGKIIGLGCGFGGPVNSHNGSVLKSVQIEGWSGFPLKDWFENKFNIPAHIYNDTNAAAWGEYVNGWGKGTRQFFYTNMGSGVGGGLIINGNLFDGQGYGAAEFGQSYVPDWTGLNSRLVEKIENLCSGWAIEKRLQKSGYIPKDSMLLRFDNKDFSKLTVKDLGIAAERGDRFANQEIDQIAHSMAIGLTNVLCLLNVEMITIGGGVSHLGDKLIIPIRKYVKELEFISSSGHYEIHSCSLGETIVLVGAILLAASNFAE